MSMPNITDINSNISLVRDDAINITIMSIAKEELALAHILNAEGEKLQYVLGTLEEKDPGEITICDIMAVNNSVQKTLVDNNNQDNKRPSQITVNLLQNSVQYLSKTVNSPAHEDDMSLFSDDDVPQFYDEGSPFSYTLNEDVITDYSKNIAGFDITNTRIII